ncbi:hypothetical protein U3516DRAFT_808325 [Neocallimastix sp. 'constans']
MVVLTPFDDSISNYPDLAYVYFFCRKFSTIFPQFTPLEIEKALTERGYPSLIILRTIIIVFLRNLYPNNVDSINFDNWEDFLYDFFEDQIESKKIQENPLFFHYRKDNPFLNCSTRKKIMILKLLCLFQIKFSEKVQENIKLIYGKVTHNLTLVDLMDCPIGQDSINRIYFYTDSPRLYRIHSNGCFESVTDTKEEVEELIKSLNSEDIKEKRLKDKLENVILKYIDMANEPSEKKNEEVIIIEDDDDDENDDNNQSNDNDNKVFVKKTIEETTENFEKLLKIITVNNDTNKKSKENRETTLKREKEDNGNEKEKEKNNSRNTKRRRLSINKRILKLYIDGLYYSFNQLKEIMDSYCE